ncbi:nitroreductase/quinone reductase family protein [Umezawaea sp. Da 62-37]|uniref:nitroreductase/quinone reductase family protein n=1 Tax=Umezawaea sp. Da 62-37 TaxID=3075927 RepID=UPI0028F6DAD1|nr:nitroreductase/quinone reductase family protein [Umezawaea sp. Da 62-37]WNV86547.1 nitroreductase/quinone reductase family protein [Umezawaea sp. Da 62-37]
MSFNQSTIDEFRANHGQVGGFFAGGDLLLLTTTGARSGAAHTVPLGYVRDGDELLVVASAGGADRHPAWFHNLLAHPLVRVEVGTEAFDAVATPAGDDRRELLFERVTAVAPGYADYQGKTSRTLPVVVLRRSEPAPPEVTTLAGKLVEVHGWLREQLVQVRVEADEYFAARNRPGPAPAPGLGLQLRKHCLEFCDALAFHHRGEDGAVFPGVRHHHPHLGEVLDRLDDEHRVMARVQAGLLVLLDDIGTADPEPFRAALTRLSDELRAHLDHEEEFLLPVLADLPWPPVA